MIVRNKQQSIDKAHEVALKILDSISREVKDFDCDDDPAEQIYLAVHILGNLTAKVCALLDGYGKIYGIPALTTAAINDWIKEIVREHLVVIDSKNKD